MTIGSDAMSLTQLETGRPAEVRALEGGRAFQERMISYGFAQGARVEVLRRGRSGPLMLRVGDGRLALGRRMAERVLVRPID